MPTTTLRSKWLFYALLSIFWWGIFGFLGKIGAERISPSQMQILFTGGIIPIVVVCFFRLGFKIETNKRGVFYSILMGLFAALGVLTFFVAIKAGAVSIVAPATSLSPVLTVILALIFLKEKLNKIQAVGLVLAMISIVILSM